MINAIVFRIGLKRQPLTKYILTWRPQNPWQDKNSSTMSSGIPTRAVVPWVGHINAVVAVPEFVVRSIVFANIICSSKAEKSITLQLCWFTSSPHMRFQHHRRSEKHHTPTKVCDHFWSGLNVQYRVSLIKLNYPKRPDHKFFFYLSVGHVGADVLTRGKLWAWGNPNLTKSHFHIFQTCPNNFLNGFLKKCHNHLPWGLGSLPCSYPGTSCPSSSRSSQFPCRTWMLWLIIWGATIPII